MEKIPSETDRLQNLVDYLNNEAEEEKKQEVETGFQHPDTHRKLYQKTIREYYYIRWAQREQAIDSSAARQRLLTTIRKSRSRLRHLWIRIAIPACVALFVGILLFNDFHTKDIPATAEANISPGSAKARLILSSGKEIDLTTAENLIQEEAGTKISVEAKGQLSYQPLSKTAGKKINYNKIIVPRGGEYFVQLSDDTRIWLNADSELEFPVNFDAATREVSLKGEAYFEVTHRPEQPFIVKSGHYRLQVYGTAFNLNTYHRDNIQVVLVKGSLGFKANETTEERRLTPNQIGLSNEITGQTEVHETDVYPYIAWKNQDMVFINEPLESILEKISRWYDVDIMYQNEALKNLRFFGNVKRYAKIEEFLDRLSATSEARFTIEGRTILVYRN